MSAAMAVVLAAGRGTRMKSELPKVLFPVLGRPMIHWVLDALAEAGINRSVVVVGYRAELVQETLANRTGVEFAIQAEQKGTGHAVQMCQPQLEKHSGPVLVVAGDSPLIQSDSILSILKAYHDGDWACLLGTLIKEDPAGLGRIVRDSEGRFEKIVEHKDASDEQRSIREVNMSTYLFSSPALGWSLGQLSNENAQGEFYLTDCPEILRRDGRNVDALPILKACESLSINTIEELELVEQKMTELGYPAARKN
jgi:bifunctional UDP-N-acetylglucosamine pyrophosphorylase/glucosamine-1-phosphate N-acetyltransferase/UDP-N-acetylglucosamine pyrophosphorylase